MLSPTKKNSLVSIEVKDYYSFLPIIYMGTLIGLKEMDLLKDRSCAFAISIWF